jgi:hypothetical protein
MRQRKGSIHVEFQPRIRGRRYDDHLALRRVKKVRARKLSWKRRVRGE